MPALAMWVVCFITSGRDEYSVAEAPEWVWEIRDTFVDLVGRWGGDGAALVPGLVVGDTRALPESLDAAMRVASLSHLTAVSGANCAIVVSALYGVVALFGGPLWARVSVSIVGLGLFVLIVGAEPSVVRASIMALIALIAISSGRETAGLTALCWAVIISLALFPTLSHSIGFALSVAATVGILVLVTPLASVLGRFLPGVVATGFAVPIAAGLAVQPILLVFAPVVPTFGVVANLLVAPLVPVATIAGLAALVLSGLPVLALPCAWIAWACASAIAGLSRFVASLPSASIPWPNGAIGIAVAAVITALLSMAIIRRSLPVGLLAMALVIVSVSTTVGGTFIRWLSAPADWSWAQCDVGQGDAVVVRDSGATMLIDTGRDEAALQSCLSKLGLNRVDVTLLTHFDADHVGAVAVIARRTSTVLHGPPDGDKSARVLDDFRASGVPVIEVCRGATGEVGRLTWRVLWPTCVGGAEPGNPASVVVEFVGREDCRDHCVSGLTLGDLPKSQQMALMALERLDHYDVVKVSHHGSRDQAVGTYNSARASVALIGVGKGNEYGHPTSETLAVLASAGSTVLRSDRHGLSLIHRGNHGELSVWRERAG